MKKVILVVEIYAEVPDETDTNLLHLGNAEGDFRIEEASKPVSFTVLGFSTVETHDDGEEEEEE